LVDGLRFAGMAMQIYDARGAVSAGVIVIDITRIGELTANQWLTEQENRPFYPDGSRWTLRGTLADAAQDTRANALQFLLLHEIGHVLSVGTELAPPFSTFLEKPTLAAYPYFARFWQPGQEAYAPRPGADSPLRARVSYNRAALGAADMPAVYEWMRGTGFPSLYGAGNPWEDFAEAFATYVHTEMMGRPYAVTLYRDGAPTRSYAACWAEKRCEDRRPYVLRALQARRP
jgi:hypothetical protein